MSVEVARRVVSVPVAAAAVEPVPVALRGEYPTRNCRTVRYTVYRLPHHGQPFAELWKGPQGWTVYVIGVGVRLSEPVHATVDDALAWHGWVESR